MSDPDLTGYPFTESGLKQSYGYLCRRYPACWMITVPPASGFRLR